MLGEAYILLALPELDGGARYAQLVTVRPCPAIANGPGRVVLGTFHHSAGDVYDVGLSDGSRLGVTARHPVWSVDRGEWVSVGDLEPGETLETLDGPRSCGVTIAIANPVGNSAYCQRTVFSAWWHDAQCDRDRMLAYFGGNVAGR